jgi:hypothetical protein
MKIKALKYNWIPIYIVYLFFFVAKIYNLDKEFQFSNDKDSQTFMYYTIISSVLLLLYGILLYSNIVLKQKKMLAVNSIITASVFSLCNTVPSFILSFIVLLFGLVIAGFLTLSKNELS